MGVTFVTDTHGNVFSLPIGPEHNAAIAAGIPPEGFQLVFMSHLVSPKFANLMGAAACMYQLIEQSKIMFETHSEDLMNVGTPLCGELAVLFERMAANLNLVQRQAVEGLQELVDQQQK